MSSLKRLSSIGLLISLSMILSEIKISTCFALGGSIALFSFLPIIIISFRYGYKYGVLSGSIIGILHLTTNNIKFQGFNTSSVIISILLDYIISHSIVGLASIIKYKFKNIKYNLVLGVILAFILKFIIHIISGILIWTPFINSFIPSLIYSISYNASYNIPQAIINLIGILMINKFIPNLITPTYQRKDLSEIHEQCEI